MKLRRTNLLLLFVLSTTLQGCAIGYIGAHLGMMGIAATQARPDREMHYKIELSTSQNEDLLFEGSTDCPHTVSMNGAGYSTLMPYSSLKQGDENWVLTGISCNDELKEEKKRRYILYKEINEKQGKVYFVTPGSSAQLMNISIDSSIIISNKTRSSFNKYPIGPFLYQKIFLSKVPASVNNYKDPVVVDIGGNICGRQNTERVLLSKKDFNDQFRSYRNIAAIEEGYLGYLSENGTWIPRPSIEPTFPLDVAVIWDAYAMRKPLETSPEQYCTRFSHNNQIYYTSRYRYHYAVLYVPEENAYYHISKPQYYDFKSYLSSSKKEWESCAKPENSQHFVPGIFYNVSPDLNKPKELVKRPKLKFVRQNQDGSYSCGNKNVYNIYR